MPRAADQRGGHLVALHAACEGHHYQDVSTTSFLGMLRAASEQLGHLVAQHAAWRGAPPASHEHHIAFFTDTLCAALLIPGARGLSRSMVGGRDGLTE